MTALFLGMALAGLLAQETPAPNPAHIKYVTLVVMDDQDRLVCDLESGDLSLKEEKRTRPIVSLDHLSGPLTMGILLDNSGSVEDAFPALVQEVEVGVRQLLSAHPGSRYFVVLPAPVATFPIDLTDRPEALQALLSIQTGGRTALFDATVGMLRILKTIDGRSLALVVSDGEDNARAGSKKEAEKAVGRSEALIFSIFLKFNPLADEGFLKRSAELSGGLWLQARSLKSFSTFFETLEDLLGCQYRLGFEPIPPSKKEEWRDLKVEVTRDPDGKKRKVLVRKRYLSSPPNASP